MIKCNLFVSKDEKADKNKNQYFNMNSEVRQNTDNTGSKIRSILLTNKTH